MAILGTAPYPSKAPTIIGMPAKQVSLVTLCFQNSALILIMHYSRIMPQVGDHRYFASTAVFLSEVIKLSICLCCCIAETSRALGTSATPAAIYWHIRTAVSSGDSWRLAVPAVLYTLQNSLQYVAVGNLDAVHFQVLSQFKILAAAVFSVTILRRSLPPKRWLALLVLTFGVSIVLSQFKILAAAVFSVTILRRSLPPKRWLALLVLTFGVSIVCIPHSDTHQTSTSYNSILLHHDADHFFPRSVHELGQAAANGAHHVTKRAAQVLAPRTPLVLPRSATYQGMAEDEARTMASNYTFGVFAALIAAASSGLAGVYFEKILKDAAAPPNTSIWTRNVQLSFYSLFPALIIGVFFKDGAEVHGAEVREHGFFDGYNWVVWTAIFLQSAGGVLSSMCINYADNIAKNFAASISIVVSFVFSVLFFDFVFGFTFILGTSLVMFATYLYSSPERKMARRPPPLRIASYQKAAVDPMYTPRLGDDLRPTLDPLESVRSMALSTSRPSSPMRYPRSPSARNLSKFRGD
ncbi:UDP-galactose transporter like protein [Verticillium longisporum]|nr:UDP-galactose transporter like protein [Verticillium longisporum]